MRLKVMGERENGRARGRRMSPSRAPVYSCAHYFQAPATQAIFVWQKELRNDFNTEFDLKQQCSRFHSIYLDMSLFKKGLVSV